MQLCLEVIFDPCCRKNKEKLELDQSPYWIEQLEKERYSPEYIELKQVVEPQGLKYIFAVSIKIYFISSAEEDLQYPSIPMGRFPDHVHSLHQERDEGFEDQFQVNLPCCNIDF